MAIPAVVISKIQGSVAKLTLMQQANKLRALIKQGNTEGLKKLVSSLKPDVLAKLISQLSADEKAELVKHVKDAYDQNIPEHVAAALGIEIADEPKMVASLKYVDPGKAPAAAAEKMDEPHFDQPAPEAPPLPKVLVELKEAIDQTPISQEAKAKLSAQVDQFWADYNNADLPADVRKSALQKLETLGQLVGLKKEVGKAQKLIKKFKTKYPKSKKWQGIISEAQKALESGQYALAFAHLETARAILKTNGLIKQLKGFLKNASLDKSLKEQYGNALSSLKLYKKALYGGNVEKAQKHGKKADKWLKKADETAKNIARANKQQVIKSGQKLVNEFGPGTTIHNLLKQAYPEAMQALAEDFKTLKYGKVDEDYVAAIKRVDQKIRKLIRKLDLKEFSKAVKGIQQALKGLATEHSKIPALQMQILRSLMGDDDVPALGLSPAFNQLKKNYGGVSGIFQLAKEKSLVQLVAALKKSGDTKAYQQAVAQVTDLSRCHTVSDLVVMLDTVLDLKHAGLLNWSPKKMESYLKQIQNHQLIKNAQKDIEIGQIIATIEVITAAAAVSAICGAFALPAMGLSASTIGGFFVYNGINALVFTSLYKPMAVGMELEENLWQSPTEYLTDFGKNYAMFLVLGAASKGFQALVKAPTTILGKAAYGAGELATEYAAFNAWSLTEQAVHAGLSEELKVADVFTAENLGNVSKQNAIMLLGLKMGGLITRPVVGPITRGLLAEAHVSKLSAYEAKAEKLAKKTQLLYEKGGKPKDFIKLYKQQNKLLKERISLMKEIDGGSGVYAEEIKALEKLYAEQTKVAEHSVTILPEGKVIVFEAKSEKPAAKAEAEAVKEPAEAKKPEKEFKLQRDEDAEAAAAQAEQQFLKEAEALAKEWQAALDLQFGKTEVDVNEVAKVQSQAEAKEAGSVSKPIIIENDGKVIKYKLEFDDGQVVTLDSGLIGKDGKVKLAGGHENYDQMVQKYGAEKAQKIVEYRQKLVSGKKAPPPLPAKAAKKGATPPPIPADAKKAGKKPPPLPPAAKKVQSGAYAKMTVADLAGKYMKQGVDYLKFITGLNTKGQIVEGFERPAAANGKPGALVEVKGNKKMIFVGDLHANIENLNMVLKKYGESLQKGEAVLVFLGDAIHPENGNMADMKSSIQTMDAILQLTAEGKAVYLKGNHDEVWGGGEKLFAKKNGNGVPIFQGVEFQKQFYAHKKAEYLAANPTSSDAAASAYAQKCTKELQSFYDNAPLILVKDGTTGLIAGHTPVLDSMTLAMATTGGVELKDALINAHSNPDLVSSLTWARPEKQASKQEPFKYSQADIESMILELGLPAQTLVLTGHTHGGSQQAVYLPPGTKGVATIMSSYKDALSVVEAGNGYSTFVDLKGQSVLGGMTAGKPQTAAAAK